MLVVKFDPLAKIIPFTSAASNLCAPPCRITLPLIELAEPEATDIFRALLPSKVIDEPASICKSDPVAPEMVRVLPLAPACNFAAVLLLTIRTPIVWLGTLVSVGVKPVLMTSTSSVAGIKRLGVQLVGIVQSAIAGTGGVQL